MNNSRAARVFGLFVLLVGILTAGMTYFRVKSVPSAERPETPKAFGDHSVDSLNDHRKLTIVLSGAMLAEVAPCGCSQPPRGGLARRVTAIDGLRVSRNNPLHVIECGDSFFQGLSRTAQAFHDQSRRKAGLVAEFLRRSRVKVFAPGESDFLLGSTALTECLDPMSGTPVSSNLTSDSFPTRSRALLGEGSEAIPVYSVWDRGTYSKSHLKASGFLFGEISASLREARKGAPPDLSILVLHAATPEAYREVRSSFVEPVLVVLDPQQGSLDDLRLSDRMAIVRPRARGTDLLVVDLHIPPKGGAHEWYDLARLDSLREAVAQLKGEGGNRRPTKPVSPETLAELDARVREEERSLFGKIAVRVRHLPLGPDVSEEREMKASLDAYVEWARTAIQAENPGAVNSLELRYKGATQCGTCHAVQAANWRTTAHAAAFATLERELSTGNPDCLACHSTGYLSPGGIQSSRDLAPFHGVQCEACHIPTGLQHPGKGAFEVIVPATCRSCHTPMSSPAFSFDSFLPRATCRQPHPLGDSLDRQKR